MKKIKNSNYFKGINDSLRHLLTLISKQSINSNFDKTHVLKKSLIFLVNLINLTYIYTFKDFE